MSGPLRPAAASRGLVHRTASVTVVVDPEDPDEATCRGIEAVLRLWARHHPEPAPGGRLALLACPAGAFPQSRGGVREHLEPRAHLGDAAPEADALRAASPAVPGSGPGGSGSPVALVELVLSDAVEAFSSPHLLRVLRHQR